MLASFLTFINDNKIPLTDKRTILTVSGGIDSVVMAHLFHKAGFDSVIAHVNFGLRGKESDDDELFVKELADFYQFPFFFTRVNTKSYSKEKGISTQMAARDLRYEWFELVRKEAKASFVATAHHADDSLETVLLNLVRGTGLSGLKGILPFSGSLIRPLLFATREEILIYAKNNNLSWREDSSNKSNDYKRNLLRNEVLPLLRQLNPSVSRTFTTSSDRLQAAHNLVTNELTLWKEKFVSTAPNGLLYIAIDGLLNSSEATFRLFSVLEEFNFSYKKTQNIINCLEGQCGKKFISSSHTLIKDRTQLMLSPNEFTEEIVVIANNNCQTETSSFRLSIYSKQFEANDALTATEQKATFDTALLTFPLQIRNWKSGDTFYPFGMKGKRKKISDLLVDRKVPLALKKQVLVLTDQADRIIWVIGHRTDERFKVTDKTLSITLLEIENS